jgi:hypothetical protein
MTDQSTLGSTSTKPQKPTVPLSEWAVDVLAQADRLDSELVRADHGANVISKDNAQELIEQARRIANREEKINPIRDWWSGLSVETAWRCLQQAQEELWLVRPANELKGEIPYLRRLAQAQPSPDAGVQTLLDDWQSGELTIDPFVAKPILAAAHVATNNAHMAIRRLRNRILVLSGVVAAVVIALWSCGVTEGDIVGLGALGGLLSVVFAVKNADLGAAYNVQLAQGVLKLTTGAGTAILAVALLKGGGAASDATHLQEYAAIFGFSQQGFTRLVDEKAQVLTGKAPPRAPVTAGQGSAARPPS